MSEKRKVLKNYRDFVRDSNKAFKQMYKDLSDEIDSLDSQMHADADAYNKDHGMFDGDRIRFYDFW